MKIEIGKTYEVNPTYKKCVVDVEHYSSQKYGNLDITTVWRWGTWYVTPQNSDEVKLLEEAMVKNFQLEISSFSDYEMRETWDGCSEDLEYHGDVWTEDEFEIFENEYYEDSWVALDKYGFDIDDTDTAICCTIDVKEVE